MGIRVFFNLVIVGLGISTSIHAQQGSPFGGVRIELPSPNSQTLQETPLDCAPGEEDPFDTRINLILSQASISSALQATAFKLRAQDAEEQNESFIRSPLELKTQTMAEFIARDEEDAGPFRLKLSGHDSFLLPFLIQPRNAQPFLHLETQDFVPLREIDLPKSPSKSPFQIGAMELVPFKLPETEKRGPGINYWEPGPGERPTGFMGQFRF